MSTKGFTLTMKTALSLIATWSIVSSVNAQVVFQDDYTRPGVPPAASQALAGSLPQVGAAYSGNGSVLNFAQATGVDQTAGLALGGGNILKTGGGGFSSSQALLTSIGEAATQNQTVQISFDFYMATGSSNIDFNSFAGSGTFGRGFDILLASNGAISWFAGSNSGNDFVSAGGSFALDQKNNFSLTANFGAQTFSANIGGVVFNGQLSPGSSGIGNLLFYTSGTPGLYVDNLSVAVVPEPATVGLMLGSLYVFGLISRGRLRKLAGK